MLSLVIKIVGMILSIGILSYLSAKLYRFGGSAKKGNKWDFLRDKLTRRLGCMILKSIAIIIILMPTWDWKVVAIYLISAGIAYGALTTYWDDIFKYDNHYAHGFGIGLANLPLAIFGYISWIAFGVHIAVITLFMGIWSAIYDKDTKEEYGRGSAVAWTQLALLIS